MKKRLLSTLLVLCLMLTLLPGTAWALNAEARFNASNFSTEYMNSTYYQNLQNVMLTGNYRTDIIAIAESQIGYHEGNSEEQLDGTYSGNKNYSEYGRYFGSSGTAWCSEFASWCARMAEVPTDILANSKSASIKDFAAPYFTWTETVFAGGSYLPQMGDLVLFASEGVSLDNKSLSHTAIVYGARQDGDTVVLTVIEGNVNNNVAKRDYVANASDGSVPKAQVGYFVAPNYDAYQPTEDGRVDLKPTNEVRWIDRVELPDYALKLYEVLEEAADGDGYNDYLIDDEYYDLDGEKVPYNEPGDFIRGTVNSSNGGVTRFTGILVTTTEDAVGQDTKDYIANCIRTVMSAFWRDHSEVFWTDGIYRISFTRNGTRYYCLALCADYSAPEAKDSTYYEIRRADFRPGGRWDIRSAMARQDADIETILSTIPTGADRLTQIYYINDWLAENNGYNTEVSSGAGNPWYVTKSITALEGREGVEGPDCGGYASAFKALCDALDIPCVNVHGIGASGGSHRWNYVQMEDGNWYAVDPNYNDNSKDRTRYLLVGAQTVVNRVKFIENHTGTNPAYYGGVESFINGPVLNVEAYPRNVHLAYWGVPETLTLGDSVAMTPVLIFASDADYTYSSTPLPEGLTLNPDTGEITGKIKDDADELTVTVTATNPSDPADAASCTLEFPLASSLRYTDVARSDWFYKAVVWATENGVTYGKTETKFGPNDTVTRAQAVTFLWRAMGELEPGNAQNPFKDVAEKDYYYKAVLWAVEQGITAGTSATAFSPEQTCSYGHILTFLWRNSGKPKETGKGAWYADALAWAKNAGLIDPNRAVANPEGGCPRADVVTYLWRRLGNTLDNTQKKFRYFD